MSNRTKTPFRRHRQSDSSAYPAPPVVGDRSRGGRKEALVVMVAAAGLVALGSLATLNGAANRGGFGGGVVAEPSHRSNVGRRLLDDAARPGRRRIGGARFDRVVYPPNNGDGKERGTLRQLLADDYETGVGEGDAQVSAEEETEEDVQREIAEEKEEEREIAEEAREERAEAREERRERREQRQEMREAVEEVKEEVAEEQEEEAEAEAEAEAEEAKEEQEEEAAEARDSAEENEREEEEREEEQAAAVEEE